MVISNWRHIGDSHGMMSGLSESIRDMEQRNPDLLPDIREGEVILVASDYGGQHNLSTHESLSFLFADLNYCGEWEERRSALRAEFLPDGRRMAFKNLNDIKRKQALFPFLLAANYIPGLSITFLIHKGINSLFVERGKLQVEELSHWSKNTIEKLLRVIHFISFFLEGLSRPHQDVFWFTDEDDIAPNEDKVSELNHLLAHVSSHYLTHDMGVLRCGTTQCDDGTRLIEDFVSVPDLIAGALADVLTNNPETASVTINNGRMRQLENLPPKTKNILAWFKDTSWPLKRLVCVIDPARDQANIITKWLQFHLGRDNV